MKKKPTMMLNEDEAFDRAGNEILALTKKLIDNGMARRDVIAALVCAGAALAKLEPDTNALIDLTGTILRKHKVKDYMRGSASPDAER